MATNRNFKRFPNNDYTRRLTSHYGSAAAPVTTHYEAPGRATTRVRKIAIFVILISLICLAVYAVWDSFARYEAFGVVDANVISISSPTTGEIQNIFVYLGQRVEKDQVVAHVVNSDDIRELDQIDDQIGVVSAEIEAKHSQLLWQTGRNRDEYYKAESELESAQGELAELKSRHALLERTLRRFTRLRETDVLSQFEYDKTEVEFEATQDLIESKARAVVSLQNRLPRLQMSIADEGRDQILPLEERLDFLRNEKARLDERIAEGTIRSPVAGVVSHINRLAGERVDDEPLLDIVEDGTIKFVLYYRPDQRLPPSDETMDLWISSRGKYLTAKVAGNSKDSFFAPSQIKRKYDEDERLVRVFLEAPAHEDDLVVGGVIMKPTNLRRIVGNVFTVALAAEGEDVNL